MTDIIKVLPDHIANQIAAGEVIQRPASAVKELLENAVDAGADEIKLIVNDAGKSLVQVIDNGKGMSLTDARMAFERHATSKINSIEDLFNLKSMGFRGEALASIAAVAQVELKTRRAADELGTHILIENSKVILQEPSALPQGSSIAMKNVFFNVPARRHFLKSNTTELRNIIDEFTRVALAFPAIRFIAEHNGQQLFFLEKGSLKQRIIQLLGNNYQTKLVAVNEQTDYLTISGFVGKPDMARKNRGDQYFFVNNRFIKSAYLHHAVVGAFDDLIAKDSHPSYVLKIDLDPAEVDVNVHPTKQEIKFTDEKIVYAFVQAAVKHALAQFSIAPSLDFNLDAGIQQLDAVQRPLTGDDFSKALSSDLYQSFTQKNQAHAIGPSRPPRYEDQQEREIKQAIGGQDKWMSELARLRADFDQPDEKNKYRELEHEALPTSHAMHMGWLPGFPLLQLHQSYIIAHTVQGYLIVHQKNAHERIIYERLQRSAHGAPMAVQQSLFPVYLELKPQDALLLQELLPDLHHFGYRIVAEPTAPNRFMVQGTPADVEQGNEQKVVEQMLEQLHHFQSEVRFSKREQLMRTLAWQQSIKNGTVLSEKEMQSLLEQLFACHTPNATPGGKPTYISYQLEQLTKAFS